jgi:hypothetical protein
MSLHSSALSIIPIVHTPPIEELHSQTPTPPPSPTGKELFTFFMICQDCKISHAINYKLTDKKIYIATSEDACDKAYDLGRDVLVKTIKLND